MEKPKMNPKALGLLTFGSTLLISAALAGVWWWWIVAVVYGALVMYMISD